MGESCSLSIHVKNSKGEIVESKLFNDLLSYLPNRELAKKYYRIGTNKEFLDAVNNRAKFDENGEITFNSLRKLAKINIKQEEILAKLNKEIGADIHTYQDAITKLTDFNRNNQFKENYMATISREGNKYKLQVVPRTSSTEASLEKEISDRTLMDRIMYRLNKAGVSVEFLEEDSKYEGRYSTVNAKKAADGLYNLIKVAKGERVTEHLAEEAGHFAIGALGKSPLVQRLTALLTPEVQKEILGDEYNTKALGSTGSREVAGTLVGRAFMNEVDTQKPWSRLVTRIVDLAKRIFATIKGDQVLKDSIEAEKIARDIARDFMSDNTEGSIENALEIRETLYSATNSLNTRMFREVVNNLSTAISKLRSINDKKLADKMRNILNVTTAGRAGAINNNPVSITSEALALDGITTAMHHLLDMIGPGKEINNILDSVDFLNESDFFSNMAENGNKLRQVHTFVRTSIELQELLRNAADTLPGKDVLKGDLSNVQFIDDLGNIVTVDLTEILRNLESANRDLLSALMTKEKQFFLRFCEDVLGKKYIYRSSRVIWNLRKKKHNPNGKTERVMVVEGSKLELSQALELLESDINMFERYLGSMSNNSDVIGQIADKAAKTASKMADDLTNKCWDELRELQIRFKKFGIDVNELCEKNDDGSLTGNIISDRHWGRWEKDWNDFKKAKREEFERITPNINNYSSFEVGFLWDKFFRGQAKQWHKVNSSWDSVEERYIPNENVYDNSANFNLLLSKHPEMRKWYYDYMQLKQGLDRLLPEHSTTPVRMPQFKGTFTNIVKNQTSNNIFQKGKVAFASKLRDTFCESSEDTMFGSDQTYNSMEEEMFASALTHEREQIHRVPLYGINKLQDMNELSTDIFHSTLAYAGMASTYAALNMLVDTLEVGKEVLLGRKVGNNTLEKNRKEHSRAYTRYLKFLDKQVYGISSSKTVIGKNIVVEKIIAALSNFASKYFLGGNVVGGIVNTGTGTFEVFKEALSDEHFSVKDWTYAHKLYYKNFVQNWMEYGKEFKNNEVGLFIRHFNALNENKLKQRTWHTENARMRRIYNMLNESLFLPYKSGDHYMQSMAYLSLAHKIKVYDDSGHRISMYNAYGKSGIVGKKYRDDITKGVSRDLFDSDEDYDNFIKANNIIIQLQSSKNAASLSTTEIDFIGKEVRPSSSYSNTPKLIEALIKYSDNLVSKKARGENTLELRGIFFKNKNGKEKYDLINSIISKIRNSTSGSPFGNAINLTAEEYAYIQEKGYNIADTENILYHLNHDAEKLTWNQDDEAEFINKCREINIRLHGIYNNADKVAFQQNVVGNAILAMRGYALGMIERRFAANHYSITLGHDVEGSLSTAGKVLLSSKMSLAAKAAALAMPFNIIGLPIGDFAKKAMYEAGFSKNQVANMRRNCGDYLLILGLFLLRSLTAPNDDDDDYDERSITAGLLYYFSSRLLMEQAAFNIPSKMYVESLTVTDLMPVGGAALKDILSLSNELLVGPFKDISDSDYYYQQSKEGKYEEGELKGLVHLRRMIPYYRSLYTFTHPYDSYKSFEYGKTIKQR